MSRRAPFNGKDDVPGQTLNCSNFSFGMCPRTSRSTEPTTPERLTFPILPTPPITVSTPPAPTLTGDPPSPTDTSSAITASTDQSDSPPSSVISSSIPSPFFPSPNTELPPSSETDSTSSPSISSAVDSSTVLTIPASLDLPSNTPSISSPMSSLPLSTPSPSNAQIVAASSSPEIGSNAAVTSHRSNHAGAIAGGVIGGLTFIALVIGCWLYWHRRRHRTHVAPSAEFMQYARERGRLTPSMSGPTGGLSSATPFMDIQSDDEHPHGHDAPPPFTKGSFSDPVYEKLTAAAAQRQEMMSRQSEYDPYRETRVASPPYDFGEPLRGPSHQAV